LPCGPEGTCVSDCERPDLDCRTQDIGEICQADSQCTTDLCVYWQDEPSTHFCSQPCEGDGDCPGGMRCRAVEPFGEVCYPDEPPPGTLGSDCAAHAECGSYTCEDGTCVIPCDLSAGQGCPAGFECASRGDGSTYYCWAEDVPGGSCSVAAPAGPPALLVLLAALALARARRRRRRRC
ncbi:MAG TPA: MYXO-CTERM sorting domain-containing protein, partial [Kofleriaceae bacterium]|nr:MYXO-CTERM sorting domain-containing protein [Kofleriaceae bacterium]